MRLADFAMMASVAALGYSGGILALSLTGSGGSDGPVDAIPRRGPVDPAPVHVDGSKAWPPVFGALTVVEPVVDQGPAEIEPVIEPVEETMLVVWQDYTLKGLVALGPQKWAFIASDQGEALIRIGDSLADGETVAEIVAEGVWLEKDGERNLIGFKEDGTVSIVTLPSPNARTGDNVQQAPAEVIRIQDLDEAGLRKLLEEIRNKPGPGRPATQ